MNTLIITRHLDLVKYLKSIGLADDKTPHMEHAKAEDVKGKHVIGVLPANIAYHAKSVTEVPLDLPMDLRGTEVPLEELKKYAGEPATFKVEKIENPSDFSNHKVVSISPTFVKWAKQKGHAPAGSKAQTKLTTREDIEELDILGTLPYHLAQHAKSVTMVPLDIKREERGKIRTIEDMERVAGEPFSYRVKRIANPHKLKRVWS